MNEVKENIPVETKQETKTEEQKLDVKPNQETEQKETQEQINWKKFREQREIERKQKAESDRIAMQKTQEAAALKAAMDALLNKTEPNRIPSPESNDPYSQDQESEEERIKRLVKQQIEAEKANYEKQAREREVKEMPQRLNSTYNDFNVVCTEENLDYLQYHHPEIAETFSSLPDSFEKWSRVYRAIKRYIPNPSSSKEAKRAEHNLNKPQSMSVGGITQTGDVAPQNITDQKRAANWERMQRVMKGGK